MAEFILAQTERIFQQLNEIVIRKCSTPEICLH